MKISRKITTAFVGALFLAGFDAGRAQTAATTDSAAPTASPTASASPADQTPALGAATAKPAPVLVAPSVAANAILDLVATEREDTAFVSPTVHTAMYGDLATLENAAKSILHDDGKDTEFTAKLISDFVASINENISRVNSTANRPAETPEVKAKCRQIQQALSAIRRSFQLDPPAGAPKPSAATDSKMVLPTAAAPASLDTTTGRLQAAQTELKKALTSLNKSQTANHGGLIEKGRADATKAVADVVIALAYLKDHPELDPLPPGVPPTDQQKFAPASLPSNQIAANGNPKSPNVAAAMDAANAALRIFIDTPKGGTTALVLVGDIDGNRDKIMADINQINADILAGFAFALNRGAGSDAGATAPGANTTPAATTAAPNAGTTPSATTTPAQP